MNFWQKSFFTVMVAMTSLLPLRGQSTTPTTPDTPDPAPQSGLVVDSLNQYPDPVPQQPPSSPLSEKEKRQQIFRLARDLVKDGDLSRADISTVGTEAHGLGYKVNLDTDKKGTLKIEIIKMDDKDEVSSGVLGKSITTPARKSSERGGKP